jgi:hypothetical protein
LHDCPNPKCQASESLWKNGFYERHLTTGSSEYRIPIRRYRCKVCGRTASLSPAFTVPRFQYSLGVILSALTMRVSRGISLNRFARALSSGNGNPPPSLPLIAHWERRVQRHKSLLAVMANARGTLDPAWLETGDWLIQAIRSAASPELFNLGYSQFHGVCFLAKI